MTADQANTLGLVLDIVGIIVIFIWGPPQPKLEEGEAILADGKVYDEEDHKIRRRRRIYTALSRLGLILLLAGFALQLIAIQLPL